jgi:uncharacterized protein YcbX
MHVAELWRFPVKSLRGEPLRQAQLSRDGIVGDRVVHVRSERGVITGRTRHALLGLSATTSADGAVLINGLDWRDPRALALVRRAAGPDASLAAYAGPERFDVLPLLVATDGAIAAFGYDGRRLRANIVIAGVDGRDERSWPGRSLEIGDVLIGVESVRSRCVVTTIDPDTGEQDVDVLRHINREFDGRLALNCWVERGGEIRVGDRVSLVDADLATPVRGGWVVGAPYRVPRESDEGLP